MQATLFFTPSSIHLVTPPKPLARSPLKSISTHLKITHTTCPPIKATTLDTSTVDYSSMTSSVFPAEACETIGGEACDVEMYPETKPKSAVPPTATSNTASSESVDREYLVYNEPKTVFLAEACDDLGGEFCEAEYQTGVY
ncbi:light-regulated protein, chloroplastic [Solanum dulcamara]|uniref:light-regulated protein, chloroplastic n=1 Tax=Solanum dulcamara TaxID=45834 RepID=UPI002485085E|nr:light-regulated protein, chloroplastic [Solanum dulcamara]